MSHDLNFHSFLLALVYLESLVIILTDRKFTIVAIMQMQNQNRKLKAAQVNHRFAIVFFSCESDPTSSIIRYNNRSVGLRFEAFQFVRAQSRVIYVECEVLVCRTTNTSDSRCNDCSVPSKKRRGRRQVDINGTFTRLLVPYVFLSKERDFPGI